MHVAHGSEREIDGPTKPQDEVLHNRKVVVALQTNMQYLIKPHIPLLYPKITAAEIDLPLRNTQFLPSGSCCPPLSYRKGPRPF